MNWMEEIFGIDPSTISTFDVLFITGVLIVLGFLFYLGWEAMVPEDDDDDTE